MGLSLFHWDILLLVPLVLIQNMVVREGRQHVQDRQQGTDLGLDSSLTISVWYDPGWVPVLDFRRYILRETILLLLGMVLPPQQYGYLPLPALGPKSHPPTPAHRQNLFQSEST